MPVVGSIRSHEFLFNNKNGVDLALTDEVDGEWHIAVAMVGRVIIYAVVMGFVLGIVLLLIKLMDGCGGDEPPPSAASSETNRLLAKEGEAYAYGTYDDEEDGSGTGTGAGDEEEAGKCSSSKSSSEDLYNGKICVICYDKLRNCFFIPCGHCATCYHCARRIKNEESQTCPVCRRYIRKVKRLFI